jgi:hypothetical protein
VTADPHAQDPANPTPGKAHTFQETLNLLLEAQATEDPNKPGTFIQPKNTQIADAINAKYGPGTITDEYVRRLRNGTVKSPSVQMASVLAGFFQLPLDVFNATGSDTSRSVMAEVQRFVDSRRQTLRDEPEPPAVAVLARTARRLSPAGQRRAAQFVQQLEQVEAMENETLA